MKKPKALLLFSGGLDSILAAKILEAQKIDVTALVFESFFFGAEEAQKSAKENNIKLRVENFAEAHLEIIRNPQFGRGTGMNPCIDCHLLMLKTAKKIAGQEKFDIIATGEVLGQRPMSQKIGALKIIEREAGLVGKILRPLSAKALPETEYEKKGNDIREKMFDPRVRLLGKVDREKMLGVSGRSRKVQIELAKKYKIIAYPNPAGGCVLTEKEYSQKLSELLEKVKKPRPSDFALLRIGRHFWVGSVRKNEAFESGDVSFEKNNKEKYDNPKLSDWAGTHIILGRNHEENLRLKKLAEKDDIIIDPKGVPGPTALVRGEKIEASIEASIEIAKEKTRAYSKKAEGGKIEFVITRQKKISP